MAPGDYQPDFPIEVVQIPRGRRIGLPACQGPKLYPFRPYGKVDIEKWEYVAAVTQHSVVWKVKIEGGFYALKLFGFPTAGYSNRSTLPLKMLRNKVNHNDHFNCECRAYGRLEETGLDERVVRCHGYVLLTQDQERAQNEQYFPRLWSMERHPEFAGVPVRGLVKDWIEEGTPNFDPKLATVKQMSADLRAMHAVGVINRDIKEANYLGNKLIDFSIAWTIPHFYISSLLEAVATNAPDADDCAHELRIERRLDLSQFDAMIDDLNEKGTHPRIWFRHFQKIDYYRGILRTRTKWVHTPLKGPDPFQYNWKAPTRVNKKTRKCSSKTNHSTAKTKQQQQGK